MNTHSWSVSVSSRFVGANRVEVGRFEVYATESENPVGVERLK